MIPLGQISLTSHHHDENYRYQITNVLYRDSQQVLDEKL